ncbi:MAG: hypothetical protein K6F17_03985, partial [Lachnospiraceae bacterium]|nr:hypothetical protein [Lachnospiraceae bacterium]
MNANEYESVKQYKLFVPGRLCLFGEHSDWAGLYRTVNASIRPGQAIVTGVEQGIYADVEESDLFEVTSNLPFYKGQSFVSRMDQKSLMEEAQKGGFFSYVAGVASYISENYNVRGVKINVTAMDLPIKSGLSSSAAICVLVARAFNRIYNLQMNVKGEMQAAFRGEQRTPSRCGRLDQACAYGIKPVLMKFDGSEIDSGELSVGSTMYWVIANLMAGKDTIKILGDLNKCYPFAQNDIDRSVQEAFGADNESFISEAVKALEEGDAPRLGHLMNEWQANFDKKVMPASTELVAPVLHRVLSDENIKALTYGGKGVGSQGDGSVQFLAKDEECAVKLKDYLTGKGMEAFSLTLRPGQSIRKAIIPLAGYGTREFPATKCVKKCFLPILDSDGNLKPALLIMLDELVKSGIEEICLVIGEDELDEFENFFGAISKEYYDSLAVEKKAILKEIRNLRSNITFVVQNERHGFGHAVWLCRDFAGDDPVLLLLGDFLYKSNTLKTCCTQVMDAFVERGKALVSIEEVPLHKVSHYGIISGSWLEKGVMEVARMVEKPTEDYAKEYLG